MWFGGHTQQSPAVTGEHQHPTSDMTNPGGRPTDEQQSRVANSENSTRLSSHQTPAATSTTTTTTATTSINTPPAHVQQQPNQMQQQQLHLQSSSSSNQSCNSNQSGPAPKSNDNVVSFHLKSGIFTRLVTIDADKMALGLIKQLAIAFLNEIYFDHTYQIGTYVGDYLRRHFATRDSLQALHERIILRIYNPERDSFAPFYSVSDITSDSYVSIEISERQPKHQQHLLSGATSSSLMSGGVQMAGGQHPASSNPGHLALPLSSSNYQLKISHEFHTATYIKPTYCASCSTLIIGVYKQGFQCAHCKKNYCPKCRNKAEQSGEGCLAPSPGFNAASPGASKQQQHTQQLTHSSGGDSGTSSSSSSVSPNSQTIKNSNGSAVPAIQPAGGNCEKLEIGGQHANMSKRKSANNLLHFNLANPFKSHHPQPSSGSSGGGVPTAASQSSEQSSSKEETISSGRSASKSMRSSAGALDPILQQLSKQMRDQQSPCLDKLLITAPSETPQTREAAAGQQKNEQPNKLLTVQPNQLSSSHQNLYTMTGDGGGDSSAVQVGCAGCTSASQSPVRQLSISARSSARDVSLGSSPTRHREHHHHSASSHTFISIDWIQIYGEPNCGVCNKLLKAGAGRNQSVAMCKTCKIQVHAHCQSLVLADCLSRITEASRAAASRADSSGGGQSPDQRADESKSHLKSTNSNASRDNIRLHRLAPSVKHLKRPDLTRPIMEGWLQHKTLSDEQSRRHYWRLDETDITLYESDTSPRYFKAISVSKIMRVISASSLPKQIKEDVALSSPQHQTKSANTSPSKTSSEFRAQMEAMFAFEVATGSVYLVQATDQAEASRWKGSLDAITRAKSALKKAGAEAGAGAGADAEARAEAEAELGTRDDSKHTFKPQQAEVERVAAKDKERDRAREKEKERDRDELKQKEIQPQPTSVAASLLAGDAVKKPARHHHHHYHGHGHGQQAQQPAGGYRGHHKTYTDPNRSRLYNRPRIVIKLDPMSIPDHWIEGKYLIERDRTKGVGFEELGSGQFGKVYAAISEIKTEDSTRGLWSGVPVAIKEISKARFDLRQQAKLKNEANILSRLDHPGVIILERVHDLPDKLYIVMEQLEDDMLEMIVSTEEKRLSERVTKFLTYQILEALKYLHSQNIAHCDLKPENVLLCEQRSQFPQIKLCDFGFAKIIEENSFRSSLVGTPAYLAPEVVKGERYNRSVDLWSVGVIVYVSLSGEFPFNEGENIHDQISRANFMYPDQPWAKISQQAKSFINGLLRVNSDKRLSASRAQMDTWIQDYQLWCDLCELELRVGRRWVTDDADFGRWSLHAKQHQIQVPRAALQLHQELVGD